jgi:hypothetical protein
MGIGRSLVNSTGIVSIYGGPMVASGMQGGGDQSNYIRAGALGGIRGDLELFYGVGLGLELHASWIPKVWSTGIGVSLTFGGFERSR